MSLKNIILWLVSLVLFVSCQAGPAGGGQPTDPAAVMDAYTAAINAGDVEGALKFVAEDAVYDRPAGQFQGKEQVRGFVEGLIARQAKVELLGERQVDGERVSWSSRVTLTNPDQVLMNNSESIVRNGLIVMHSARPAQ
jgi:hypothetical protein